VLGRSRQWVIDRRGLLAYLLVVFVALAVVAGLQQRANDAQNHRINKITAVICGRHVDRTLDPALVERTRKLCGRPEAGPKGRPGRPGKTGKAAVGKGRDLSRARVVRIVRPIVRQVVRREIRTVVGKPGSQGLRGEPGKMGAKGDKGAKGDRGEPGRNGVGASAHVDVNEVVREVLARLPNPPPAPDTNAIVREVLQIVCRRVPTLCS
jgi:hypothetical protein